MVNPMRKRIYGGMLNTRPTKKTKYTYSSRIRRSSRPRRNVNIRSGGYLGLENKFYDTGISSPTNISANANLTGGEIDPSTVNCISAPAQGDGESDRDGRQICITSINVKGVVKVAAQAGQTSADDGTIVFVALVLDKQSNGAQLSSEQVFSNPSNSANLAGQPMLNLQYQQRFKVIASKTFSPQDINMAYNGTSVAQAGLLLPFTFYKKVKTVTNFTGTTAGVSNVADHSYHIVAFTNSSTLGPQLLYNSRIRFMG